jgi:hypothetical protein
MTQAAPLLIHTLPGSVRTIGPTFADGDSEGVVVIHGQRAARDRPDTALHVAAPGSPEARAIVVACAVKLEDEGVLVESVIGVK